MILVLLGLLLSVGVLLIFWYRSSKYYRLISKLPCAKGLPILGQALNLCVDRDELLKKMLEIVGQDDSKRGILEQGTIVVWMGPLAIVLLYDTKDIETILTSRSLTKKGYQYKFFEPWLGNGLLTSSGAHWHNHRKLLTPAFHFKVLEKFIPAFNSNISIYLRNLDEKIKKGSFVNLDGYITHLSLDILGETAMDTKINAQKGKEDFALKVRGLTETIALRGFRLLYYVDLIFKMSPLWKKQKRYLRCIHDFTQKLIQQKREEETAILANNREVSINELGEKDRVALIHLLLELQRISPDFSDNDIKDEVTTFMFGGHDTVTGSTLFTFHHLATNPHIQEEVFNEVKSTVGGGGKFTYNNLQQMKYLERVIKESLRVCPVAPFILRETLKDIKLSSGYILPTGCTIMLFIYGLHRNPNIFPDPEKFDPDRFLPENCLKRSSFAYLPFSAGNRNCIGQKYAMLEMKAVIAATVLRYRLLPCDNTIKPVINITLRPANGLNIKLERR